MRLRERVKAAGGQLRRHWRSLLLILIVFLVYTAISSSDRYRPKKLGESCTFDYECRSRRCDGGKCVELEQVCGDQICEGSETCSTCWIDCQPCKKENGEPCSDYRECRSSHCVRGVCRPTDPWCGDGYCDRPEDCFNCEKDCGVCMWI